MPTEEKPTVQPERICAQCGYRTTLPVATRCPMCDVPLALQERTWAPTRRVERTRLSQVVRGHLDGRIDVTVLDLSIFGARLEHREALRSGWRYVLSLPVSEEALPLQLPVRVVWTRVQHAERARGQTGMLYQSGVEFRELSPEAAQELARFLGGVAGSHPGPLLATVASPRS